MSPKHKTRRRQPLKAFSSLLKEKPFFTICVICLSLCLLVGVGAATYYSYIALGGSYRSGCACKNIYIGRGEIVTFRDESFEKALRAAWGNPGKNIYTEELAHCTELTITREEDLADISDLALFPNLEKLSITHGNIQDISILSRLQNLTCLDLSYNNINDITPLSKLLILEKLDLSGNNIKDLPRDIGQMQALLELNLSLNCLDSIDRLSSLPLLSILQVQYNPMSSLELTQPFPMLLTLDLTGCPLRSIPSLDMLSLLQELIVGKTKIENLEFMKKNSTIVKLDISFTGIRDLSNLTECETLESLGLYGFSRIDLTPLKSLPVFNSIYLDSDYDRSEIDFMLGNYKTGDLRTRIYLCGKKNKLIG